MDFDSDPPRESVISLTPSSGEGDEPCCSFCTKPQSKIGQMIAGPEHVFICNECIALCVEILLGGH